MFLDHVSTSNYSLFARNIELFCVTKQFNISSSCLTKTVLTGMLTNGILNQKHFVQQKFFSCHRHLTTSILNKIISNNTIFINGHPEFNIWISISQSPLLFTLVPNSHSCHRPPVLPPIENGFFFINSEKNKTNVNVNRNIDRVTNASSDSRQSPPNVATNRKWNSTSRLDVARSA